MMLAQNFKTPADLQISDAVFGALVKVLGMLERGEVVYEHEVRQPYGFNLANYQAGFIPDRGLGECNAIFCIAGLADAIAGQRNRSWTPAESELYSGGRNPFNVTVPQAALALRSYLTHGEPRWNEALSVVEQPEVRT